jgi:predicted amidohydrolase
VSGDVRAGLAQWTPGRDREVNLATAEHAVRELGRRGCHLVLLPELWLCGYRAGSLAADVQGAAEPLDGPVQRRLAGLAAELGLVLAAGSFPELAGGAVFNTAVVYGPAGDLLLRHRKVHLYGTEPAVFRPGDALTVGDLPGLGRTGLCVCFDGDFPETARALRAAGAGLVLHPSAYEAAVASWWDTLYPAHALANGQWWLSANQHGGTGTDQMLGGSRVIAPDGRIAAAAPRQATAVTTPELLVTDLALDDELATAAAAAGALWTIPPPVPEGTKEPS